MQNFIIRITQENTKLLQNPQLGCFILPTTCEEEFAAEFISEAQKAGILVLCEGENAVDFYKKFNTDGLILNTVKENNPQKLIKQTQALAPKAILGVVCRNRRHEAMLVSECEPDFVIFKFWKDGFEANAELLNWYAELFLIQNAAQLEEDVDCSQLNADFIIIDDTKFKEYGSSQ
ncbi:MAG: hypothetical protein IKN71_07880 [Alphaproteobacteria bacterium]|nr:hypothetical protein [Alphaproteobacteria bacterium]